MAMNLLRKSSLLSRIRVPLGAPLPHRLMSGHLPEPVLSKGEVEERVIAIVRAFPKVNPAKLTPTSHFQNDLGLDSLDVVEVVMGFEFDFMLQIPDADAEKMVSIPTAVDFIVAHPMAR